MNAATSNEKEDDIDRLLRDCHEQQLESRRRIDEIKAAHEKRLVRHKQLLADEPETREMWKQIGDLAVKAVRQNLSATRLLKQQLVPLLRDPEQLKIAQQILEMLHLPRYDGNE